MQTPQHRNFTNRIGDRYGYWLVVGYAGRDTDRSSLWRCVCECGTRRVVSTTALLRSRVPSCGCRSQSGANLRAGPTRPPPLVGPANPLWKGDDATGNVKRQRCRRLYPVLGQCELCDRPATDRHHKDADPGNNARSNIQRLCRRCHEVVDGRLERLRLKRIATAAARRDSGQTIPKRRRKRVDGDKATG